MSTITSAHTSAGAKPSAVPSRLYNFSAGPGALPEDVVRQVQEDVWSIAGSGVGILEHSHRGKVVDRVWAETEADCRAIGNIPSNYKVLFLTGGATSQNFMVPANLLPQDGVADYLLTGYWAERSAEQAPLYGRVNIAASSKSANYSHIPSPAETKFTPGAAYAHYTSNNTIYGTQFRAAPTPPAGVPLVCDASSDIFSCPIDVSRYGLIYAGAQKNVGVAGATLVIVREDLLDRKPRELPLMLQYRVHAKDGSRHNTPPVFAVYVMGLVFKWIIRNGGLAAMAQKNAEKAKLIYDVLDSTPFFKGHARPDSRSLMNITFKTPSETLDEQFIKEAAKAGMDCLKGHRSTGGMRASVYNAFPRAGCEALASLMKDFARRNG